jgi:hypothetical protein
MAYGDRNFARVSEFCWVLSIGAIAKAFLGKPLASQSAAVYCTAKPRWMLTQCMVVGRSRGATRTNEVQPVRIFPTVAIFARGMFAS